MACTDEMNTIGPDWYHSIGDCIEWEDGSIDAVYTNAATKQAEFRPATTKQIEMYERHKAWVKAGCPADFWDIDCEVTL